MKGWRGTIAIALLGAIVPVLSSRIPDVYAANEKSSRVQVDRIELIGITVFERPEIEAALELNVGDPLERPKVVRTAENLQALYRGKGYEEVAVKSELTRLKDDAGLLETVLTFRVQEGKPTRIASIRLTPQTLLDPAFESYWKKNEKALETKAGLNSGDIADQDKIAAAKRALQDSLASEEFIGATVVDVRSHGVEPLNGSSASAARWIELEFRLDLGDRVTFGFRGNTVFTKGRLSAVIEEQRLVGLGKDYVGSIKARIEDEYRTSGYARAKVTPYSFEHPDKQERHISFDIEEGPRVIIDSVDFDGNSIFSNQQLRDQFFAHAAGLTQKRVYVDKEIEKAADLLIEWMKVQGYLGAKLVTINRALSADGDKIRLVVYIYEGEQTRINSLVLSGIHHFDEAEVSKVLGARVGEPLNLFAFNEGLEILKANYRDQGYLDIKINNEGSDSVIRYSQENRKADLKLEVSEGPQYRVSQIEMEGLESVESSVLKRELTFKEGDILGEQLVSRSEANLRKLLLFSSVAIQSFDDVSRPGYKIVRVVVQEGSPGLVAGGVGYRNDLGIRVFGQTAYSNLWHRNHTVSLNANINKRFDPGYTVIQNSQGSLGSTRTIPTSICKDGCFVEYQVQLGYVWPWFLFPEASLRPQITVERKQYLLLDSSSVSFTTAWERPILKHPNLVGTLTYSLERTHQFHSIDAIDDDKTLTIGAVVPSLRIDMRDSPLSPTRGVYATTSFEYASPYLGSQGDPVPVGYTRWQFRADGFIPLGANITAYLSFRTGIEYNLEAPPANDPNNKQYAIPLIKAFTLGGASSLRGYVDQDLNVGDTAVRGYASYVNYRAQIDLPFAGPMRFGPFLDAANLLVDRYSFGILRYGVGIGFHYQSPIGPVNFDWGLPIKPRPDQDPYRFYFSIGVI